MILKRMVLLASATAAIAMLSTASASAEGETAVTYSGGPASPDVGVVAAPGEQNAIVVSAVAPCPAGAICIGDTAAGVTESSPNCNQPNPTQVRCQATESFRLSVDTGDLADSFTLDGKGTDVNVEELELSMGSGNDRLGISSINFPPGTTAILGTGPGNDRAAIGLIIGGAAGAGSLAIMGGVGKDVLKLKGRGTIRGGAGADTLRGLAGPQRIFGNRGNDTVSCGKGRDLAKGGPGKDRGGAGCEAWDGEYGFAGDG